MSNGAQRENRSDTFERLPETESDRAVEGRATRKAVIAYWTDRFALPPETFEGVTFWEKGAGRIWALSHDLAGPVRIEALGLPILRTRQEFWKPTTDGALRFGGAARENVIHLEKPAAERFIAGADQEIPWEGDWGYLIVTHDIAGEPEPIGIGRYTYGSLQSMIPKDRRREFE